MVYKKRNPSFNVTFLEFCVGFITIRAANPLPVIVAARSIFMRFVDFAGIQMGGFGENRLVMFIEVFEHRSGRLKRSHCR